MAAVGTFDALASPGCYHLTGHAIRVALTADRKTSLTIYQEGNVQVKRLQAGCAAPSRTG